MTNKLTISLRHTQLYYNNDPLQPIIYECDADQNPVYVPGTVTQPDFIDFTEFTQGLDKFKTTWKASVSGQAANNSTAGATDLGSNYQKGVSAELIFTGPAFQFIYDHLMNSPCQILNSIQVQITDVDCQRSFRLFEIKVDNITYRRYDEPCIVNVALRELDDVIHVFNKTIIEDDFQNWFNSTGTSVKEHPAFMFIQEKRPKFLLIGLAAVIYVCGMLSTGILVALTVGKEWIRKVLGVCYFNPSPLIRTYIENICTKYGYTFNTMFDDLPENVYKNLCLFFPVTTDVREFENYDSSTNAFLWDNRTAYIFSNFLDKLKLVFNAEWYCTPNKELVFQPKAYFNSQAVLYDFTAPGAYPLYNYETSFNGNKKPAYGDYRYTIDPNDLCSSDLKWRYNDIVDFDGKQNNTMLEGNVTKQFDFAATSFMYDGSFGDFIKDSVEVARLIAIGAVLVGLIELLTLTNPLTAALTAALVTVGYVLTNDFVNNFFASEVLGGAVRVSNNNINVPRLLLWDGESMTRAKVAFVENPEINPFYNVDNVDYYTEHPTLEGEQNFGTDITKIYNYDMYVDANYKGNLYDRFHELDNSLKNPEINQDFTADIDFCCTTGEVFGIFEPDFVKIGAIVIVENRDGRLIKARLTEITPDYDKGMINLKGRLLK